VACVSRNIPSAFNDRDQIFNSSIIIGIFSAVFLFVAIIFDATLRSPSATAGLYITLMVGLAMITNTCVVLPKIRRVLSGEPVVVTKLLRDMNRHGSVADLMEQQQTMINVIQWQDLMEQQQQQTMINAIHLR
jgi:hypothetical protein